MIYRFMLVLLVMAAATSCAQESYLDVEADSSTMAVFYGKIADGEDEVEGPGFIYGPMRVKWKGSTPLKLTTVIFKFPAAGKFKDDVECTFDGDDIEDAFPSNNQELIPDVTYESALKFICVGLQAKKADSYFVAYGTAGVRGYTGDAASQKYFKGDTKISLYWRPRAN